MKDQTKVRRNYTIAIWAITIAVNALIALAYFVPTLHILKGYDLSKIPHINAILNSFTFLCLSASLHAIKKKKVTLHRNLIFAALGFTAVFLVTYLAYHFTMPATKYGGDGLLKYIYLFILATHIILAAAIVPLALITIARGLNNMVEKHRKLARWVMPIWLYVSFTGVLIYILISPYYQH